MAKNKSITPKVHNPEVLQDRHDGFLAGFFNGLKRTDGWMNILSGFGTKAKDARTYAKPKWSFPTEQGCEELYAGDPMASKVNDMPVDDAMAPGYEIEGIDKAKGETLKEIGKTLALDARVAEAKKKARMYGGAAILKVYSDDLRLDMPAPKDGVIKSLIVFHRFELWTNWEYVMKDMLHPDYGKPMYYHYFGSNVDMSHSVRIHRSRLIIFDGLPLPSTLYRSNGYWGDSVLNKLHDSLRNYATAHDSANAAVSDFSTAVFKIKGLADMMAADCDSKVTTRLQTVNMAKSILRAVVIDSEGEEFDYKARSMTGLDALVNKAEDRLSAESDIPKTVLMGQSPTGGGLGSGGDHSSENWYKFLQKMQQKDLAPPLLDVYREIARVIAKIPEAQLDIKFNKLWSMSEKEETEVRAKQSETDQRYYDMGVLDPVEIRQSRFGGDKFSLETKVDDVKTAPAKPENKNPNPEEEI